MPHKNAELVFKKGQGTGQKCLGTEMKENEPHKNSGGPKEPPPKLSDTDAQRYRYGCRDAHTDICTETHRYCGTLVLLHAQTRRQSEHN